MDFDAKYYELLDLERFQVDQPVIGIITMPFWDETMKTESF
jgi:gamma-glutamyl-gamma-aminobutyrate hydrolase PuuD